MSSKHQLTGMLCKRVFVDRFPSSLVLTLCLLRRRVRLSREVADDVVRARGSRTKSKNDDNEVVEQQCFDYRLHGPALLWNQNGALVMKLRYVEGKRHGIARGWYDNGERHWEKTNVNDNPHGLTRGWHENGARCYENSYVDGKRHGLDRWWSDDGHLSLEFVYENDRLVSTNHPDQQRCLF